MKKKHNFLIISILLVISGYGQLSVVTSSNPATLVNSVLVGNGVSISNITYTGDLNGIGSFSTGTTPTNLGLSTGILMSTGKVNGTTPIGGSAYGVANSVFDWTPANNQDIATLAGTTANNTFDQSVLEFDFVPSGDTMKFRFVFASEEYPDWVCSAMNDAFGFFVSGVNPAGGNYTNKNIALIPNTTIPVAINSINGGSPGTNGGNCTSAKQSLAYTSFYSNNTAGSSIVFNGFTKVLTAWCKVIPCNTYHLKLAVADVNDAYFDSGVFLESGSFSSNTINAGADQTINAGQTATLTTTGNGSYLWSPGGQTTSTINVSPTVTTTYTVTVSNGACSATDAVVVFVNNPTISAGSDQTICAGGSATLNGSGTGTYLWSPGGLTSSTITVSPIISTTYVFSVNNGGIITTDDVVVTVVPSITATATVVSNSICSGETTTLNSGGGTGYSWTSSPAGFTSNLQNPSTTPTATTTYTVLVSNGSTCSDTEAVIVTVNPNPIATATASLNTVCSGEPVTLNASGGSSYSWSSNPTGFTSLLQNPSISPTITTQYTVLVSNAGGCTDTEMVEVTVGSYPTATATADQGTICSGSSTNLHSGGGASYSWTSMPVGFTSSNANPIISPTQSTTYIVTVDNGTGCSSTNQTVVNVDQMPPIVLFPGNIVDLCAGANLVLSVNGASSYTWETGANTASLTVNPSYSSSYTVTATNGVCMLDTTFRVNIKDVPNIELGSDVNSCEGNVVNIYAQSNVTQVLWSDGEMGNNIEVSTDGIYYAVAANICGIATDSVRVSFNSPPIISLGRDTTLCVTDFVLSVPDVYPLYHWSSGEETHNMVAQTGGTYTVEVTDINGCNTMDTIVLTDSCFVDVFIPNSFTPNGDSKNEIFKVEALTLLDFEMYIYNRWGELVFHSVDVDKGWDGKYKNRICEQGNYFYIVKYQGIRDAKKSLSGSVTLF